MLSPSLDTMLHPDCLIHHYSIPHMIVSDEKIFFFTAKEVQQQVHVHGIHSSYNLPHNPEAVDLMEKWNDL